MRGSGMFRPRSGGDIEHYRHGDRSGSKEVGPCEGGEHSRYCRENLTSYTNDRVHALMLLASLTSSTSQMISPLEMVYRADARPGQKQALLTREQKFVLHSTCCSWCVL